MALLVSRLNQPAIDKGVSCADTGGTDSMRMCYGVITFTAGGDTYATGGIRIDREIRKVFGCRNIQAIAFFGCCSDASGPTTGSAQASYNAQTGFMKLFLFGRTSGSPGTAQVSEVEVAAAASINNIRLEFVAYCTGSGTSEGSYD